MLVVPERLFQEKFIQLFHHSPRLTMLRKELNQSLYERQSYVAKHAISLILEGTQDIHQPEGSHLSIAQKELGFVKKGIYTVNDLLPEQGHFQSYHFYFDDIFLEKFLAQYPFAPPKGDHQAFFKLKMPKLIPTFLESLEQIHQSFGQNNAQIYQIKLSEFLTILIAENSHLLAYLQNLQQKETKSLRGFMQSHFDKPFSIEDYAYLTGRSVSTFRREFKEKFGESPRRWIIRQRLEKAHQMLAQGQYGIQEVAYEVGYENASHFIKEFKKAYGFTPGQKPKLGQARLS